MVTKVVPFVTLYAKFCHIFLMGSCCFITFEIKLMNASVVRYLAQNKLEGLFKHILEDEKFRVFHFG